MKIEDAKTLLINCTDLICRECNNSYRGCKKQKSYPDFASTVLVALELLDRWHRQLKHCPHCGQALEWPDKSK